MDQFWALIRNRLILRYECDGKWLDYRLCLGCHPTCSHVICTLSNSKWVQLDMMTTLGIKDLTQLFPNEWPASTQTTLLRMLRYCLGQSRRVPGFKVRIIHTVKY